MAYKRNFRRKRRMNRRYKRTYKKFNARRRVGNPNQKVWYFKRTGPIAGVVTAGAGANSFANLTFTLFDVPGANNFTSLYDAYKINAVKVKLLPQFTQSVVSTGVVATAANQTFSQLRIFSAIDYNSDQTISLDDIQQFGNCKVSQYTRGHSRYFKPKIIMDSGAGTQSIQVFGNKNPWINTDNTLEKHFCLRLAINTADIDAALIPAGSLLLTAQVKYYLAFKAPR